MKKAFFWLADIVIIFLLGFVAYPAIFVPVMLKFFPDAMHTWVRLYADYLRWLGF